MPQSPLFEGLSLEQPSILTITFPSNDKNVSLGAILANHDNGLTNEMMAPGFASIGALLDEEDNHSPSIDSNNNNSDGKEQSLARKYGVKVGDYIVGINGVGYRRFPPDFPYETLEDVTLLKEEVDLINLNDDDADSEKKKKKGGAPTDADTTDNNDDNCDNEATKSATCTIAEKPPQSNELLSQVLSGKSGTLYPQLLSKIKQIKSASSSSSDHPPLILHLERYTWDSRVHSWSRFLSARNGNVPNAMMAMQQHEQWRTTFFPIDLTSPSLQKLLKAHAVSEIDVVNSSEGGGQGEGGGSRAGSGIAPVVYIDFAKLQSMGAATSSTTTTSTTTENSINDTLSSDVIKAFVIYTETLLSKAPDPRSPKTCQFVDLTGVTIKAGIQPGILKKLYDTFEPNYPETLQKMVLYPVPRLMVRIVDAMLSFVNEHTRKKFIITDDLGLVCKELGWNWKEIQEVGSVNGYMKKHLRHGLSFVFD